jgi:hypothetical protein
MDYQELLNKEDPLDKEILKLVKSGELAIKVTEL